MRRSDTLAILFLIAVGLLLYADVLFGGRNLWMRDLLQYHYPMKWVVRDTVSRGEFPYWNRLFAAGQPMAANPAYEIFYPLQWLIFAGSYRFGFALHIVAHVWLALAGMYALLRTMSLRLEAALFGALSFGIGGFLTGAITNLPTFFIWSWAPLVACCGLRFVQAPSRLRFAVAALVMAMPLLVADPTAIVQVWALLLAGALMLRAVKPLAALSAAAAGLAAVQLLPAIDHLRDCARGHGFDFKTVSDFSMPPIRPLELFVPHVFGLLDRDASGFWGLPLFAPRNMPYLLSIYCGIAVLILVAAGLAARVRGWATVATVVPISYLLAIGGHTPLLGWLYAAGLRSLRYPEKFAGLGLVTMIVFAAFAADRLMAGDPRMRHLVVVSSIGVCAMALLVAAGLWIAVPSPWTSLSHPAALSAAVTAIAWCGVAWASSRDLPRWRVAALALLLAELAPLTLGFAPRMPPSLFTPPPTATLLRSGERLFHRGAWLTDDPNRVRFSRDYPGWVARNGLGPLTPAAWNIPMVMEGDIDETYLLPTHDFLESMIRLGRSRIQFWTEPFMILSDAAWVADYRDFAEVEREANGDPSAIRPVDLRSLHHQGRYFFPRQLVTIRSIDDFVADLRANPLPFGTAFVPFPAFAPAAARVVSAKETANGATIDVESAGKALLVATVTRHKYWRATIDGAEAELLPANVAYMGVVVPPGRHRIEMRYRNPLVAVGGAVSLIALLLLAIVRVSPLHSAR